MELLNEYEINLIIKQFGLTKPLKWHTEEFSEKVIGYLGDHLKLIVQAENEGEKSDLKLFVKCMPRFDKWKSEYLKDLNFFYKEFIMLSQLFPQFQNGDGSEIWRPKLLFIREDLFVFEDVSQLGYKMPHSRETMTFLTLKATVKSVARFHAQSFIYEENKSKELGKPYRIWDDFSEYLQEPVKGQVWRNTGRNAVIDYIKEFSHAKSNSDFIEKVEHVIPVLYERAMDLMRPSTEHRNVVTHRDLWSNNIFIKERENGDPHVLLIDFQTVLYSSPMLDLSSLIYFNTTRESRDMFSSELINIYHDTLSLILQEAGVNVNSVFPKDTLTQAYDDSRIFGIIQASIIVPIVCMSNEKKEEIFWDPVRSEKANLVSRSEEFIEIAKEDPVYHNRFNDLLEEIVERYIK